MVWKLTVLPDGVFKDLTLMLIVICIVLIIGCAILFAILRIVFYPTLIKPMYHVFKNYYIELQKQKEFKNNLTQNNTLK